MEYTITVVWKDKAYRKKVVVGWINTVPFFALKNNGRPKWSFQKQGDKWVDIMSVTPLPPDQAKAITDGIEEMLKNTSIKQPSNR